MTTLHVVTDLIAGFAREDASRAGLVGAYHDKDMAEAVRKVAGFDATVSSVVVDHVPPGYVQAMVELGITVGSWKTRAPGSIPLASLEDILNVKDDAAFEQILAELPDMLRSMRQHEGFAWPIHWRQAGGPSTITTHCTDGKVVRTLGAEASPATEG